MEFHMPTPLSKYLTKIMSLMTYQLNQYDWTLGYCLFVVYNFNNKQYIEDLITGQRRAISQIINNSLIILLAATSSSRYHYPCPHIVQRLSLLVKKKCVDGSSQLDGLWLILAKMKSKMVCLFSRKIMQRKKATFELCYLVPYCVHWTPTL